MKELYPITPTDRVSRPVLLQRWESLSFIHWSYPAEFVQEILPAGLHVDTYDGCAWVGLVPFRMVRVRPPGVPVPPWITTFPETNIRTYVRGPDGGVGVWFASLEITRLLGVAVSRTTFHVPYTWSSMALDEQPHAVAYRSRRRWPPPKGVGCHVRIRPGEPIERTELTDFLVNRWRAYTVGRSGQITYAPVAHEPWRLFEAELDHLTDSLVQTAGLPEPSGTPLVHYSPGVSARIGRPRNVSTPRR